MDGSRFDRWTRTLAQGRPSRRTIVRALAAGALGTVATGLGRVRESANAGSCREAGVSCRRNLDCCSQVCINRFCHCEDGEPACGFDLCCPEGTFCHVDRNRCVEDHCTSGRRDGDETDEDCGGSCRRKCRFGQGCEQNDDCATGPCSNGLCTQCRTNSDCNPISPFCVANRCRACKRDGDCAPRQFCVRNDCATCRTDADCGLARPFCGVKNRCVECRSDADCPGDELCEFGACVD